MGSISPTPFEGSVKNDARSFPNELPFTHLLKTASQKQEHIVIKDTTLGVDANYAQLLTDVLHMRDVIRGELPPTMLDSNGLIVETRPYVFIVAPVNYEFIVTFLAILSLGGAFVAMPLDASPERALELLQKCQSNYILTGSQHTRFAADVLQYAHRNDYPVNVLPITIMKPAPANVSALNIQINPEAVIKPSRPSMITFSTGSSDTPKAIVQTRRYFYRPINTPVHATLLMAVDQNHMISTMNAICVPIFGGCRGEIVHPSSSSNSAALFWNRLRKGGVTSLSGMPQFWDSMARYYQNHIAQLPAEEREEYLKWARFLRMAYVMGMVAPARLLRFWREELKRPLQVAYGGTEFGGLAATTTAEGGYINNRCIGKSQPHVTIKLSEGDHGEILIRSPHLMACYLNEPAKTQAVFDADGFYRTGDEAHLVGEEYIYDGRIATDFITLSPTQRISVYEIETQLMENLPYLSEVYVLPVQFPERQGNTTHTHFLGVLIRLQRPGYHLPLPTSEEPDHDGFIAENLPSLRAELAKIQDSYYNIPVAVRILRQKDAVSLKKGVKVARQDSAKTYFPFQQDNSSKPAGVDMELGF